MQPVEGFVERFDHAGREPEARLVEHQQPRLAHQRAAERQHLPFAARKRAGELMAPLGKPGKQRVDPLEQGRNPRLVGEHGGAEAQILLHRL